MSETSAPAEDLLVIGKIVSVHGVRGDVKVYSFTDPIDNLLDYRSWTLRRGEEVRQVQVIKGRVQGNVLVASLKGVGDRDVARDYVDFEICIPRDLLPALDEGE